jgi:mono/diheme cytochrome c family protein
VTFALAAGVALAVGAVMELGALERPGPIVATPAVRARGEQVFSAWCLHCHADVPLARRVAGWSPERAYAVIGRLPEVSPAMPPFRGTDEERQALAVYVASLGAAEAPGPER